MHILIGVILVLLFPFLLAIVAGAWASYWVVLACSILAYGAFLALRHAIRRYWSIAADIQSAAVEQSRADNKESFVESTSCLTGNGQSNPSEGNSNPSKVARRLTACGACGEGIDRYSIYCPKCGKDPRIKS